jgi:hypothetical protein
MKQFKWKEMAWCCLFTAFKIEEKVRPLSHTHWHWHVPDAGNRDVVPINPCSLSTDTCHYQVMKMESLLKWSHHVSCKLTKMSRVEMERNKLDVNGRQFFEMKERLQFNERVLLQTIGFDVDIKQVRAISSLTLACGGHCCRLHALLSCLTSLTHKVSLFRIVVRLGL